MDFFKKIFIGIIFLFCTFSVLTLSWCVVYFNEFSTLVSYELLSQDDKNMYYVSVEGDYYMNNFIDSKGAWCNDDLSNFLKSSSSKGFISLGSFDVTNTSFENHQFSFYDSNEYYAKSYNSQNNSTMIVQTSPANKYASVSTVNLASLGIEDKLSIFKKAATPAVAYLPTDGMNETGLTVSLSYSDQINQPIDYYNSTDVDITETVLVRLILDNASTVNEAISLVNEYDLYLSSDYLFEITITDSFGNVGQIYTEESSYLGENLLGIRSRNIDIETSTTTLLAVDTLNSYKPQNEEFLNNYSVIFDKTNKTVNYYLFNQKEPQFTIQL